MSAILSPCGTYRYRLERLIQHGCKFCGATVTIERPCYACGRLPPFGTTYAFFGINPSTADATIPDQTVRKLIGFVARWNGSRFIVGNVFAYRSKDVMALRTVQQPVGPDNFAHLERIAADADVLVPFWGDRGKVPRTLHHHIDKTLAFLLAQGKPVKAFGFAKGGDPLHPLMLGYDTKLVDVTAPSAAEGKAAP